MTRPFVCRGLASAQIHRRAFLKTTLTAAVGGLTLPDVLRRRAAAVEAGSPINDTAVIQIWMGGGPTHFETYDPKPDAPAEYRGPFGAIPTNLPGVHICELLPRHARIMDKLALLRSVYHNSGDHDYGMYLCTTGKPQKGHPSTGSVIAKLRGPLQPGVPPYVHLGFHHTDNLVFVPNFKGSYLGGGYDPFYVTADPADPAFLVPNLQLVRGVSAGQFDDRRGLLRSIDQLRRDVDTSGLMATTDHFNQVAFDMITGPRARQALDRKSVV